MKALVVKRMIGMHTIGYNCQNDSAYTLFDFNDNIEKYENYYVFYKENMLIQGFFYNTKFNYRCNLCKRQQIKNFFLNSELVQICASSIRYVAYCFAHILYSHNFFLLTLKYAFF